MVVLATVAVLCGCGSDGSTPATVTGQTKPVTATGPAPPGSVTFAGWHWMPKASPEPVGPGPNRFGDALDGNVSLDSEGRLHLKVTRRDGKWYAAEVQSTETIGYGTYAWEIEPPGTPADPNAVLGLFTWSDDPSQHHREIDIELSSFRRPGEVDGQYVVQPFATPGNLKRFYGVFAEQPTTVSFTWRPGEVVFANPAADVATWTYAGPDVPAPGAGVHPRMNLWLLAGDAPANGEEFEVVIRSFTFVPLVS